MRLCERCPHPSRPATHSVIVTSGTYRVKLEKVYLCASCAEQEGADMKTKSYSGKQMPKGEARPLGTKKSKPSIVPTTGRRRGNVAGHFTRADAAKERSSDPQKVVDNALPLEVESIQSEPQAIPQAVPLDNAASGPQEYPMTLTLKNLSKNGKRAIYTGAAQSLHFPVGAFVDKTAPQTIDVSDVFAGPRAAKVVETKEERKARLAALPKKTEAERIAQAEEKLAKRKAKLVAANQL